MAGVSVLKFGGASFASARAIDEAARITVDRNRAGGVVAVVSAPRGLTDALLGDHARRLVAGDDVSARASDELAATGEALSALLLADALRGIGADFDLFDARDVIRTDAVHGNADVDIEATRQRVATTIEPVVDRGGIAVLPGFYGSAPCGATTTLGRGGSDLTAAVVASLVEGSSLTFYKEVAGVLSLDPSIARDACALDWLSHAELRELAGFGGRVVQWKAARVLAESGVPVSIRGLGAPLDPGTEIVERRKAADGSIRAVTVAGELSLLNVTGYGVTRAGDPMLTRILRQGGPALRLARVTPDGESVMLAVPHSLAQEIANGFRRYGDVVVRDGVAVVCAIGVGISRCLESVATFLRCIADRAVEVHALDIGGDDVAIRAVVDAASAADVARAVHAADQRGLSALICG